MKPTRIAAAALAVASLLASPSLAQKVEVRSQTPAVDLHSIRIDNFGQIDQAYYRGAQPKGRDYADLAALGVKTLINLTSDDAAPDEPVMAERVGLKHVRIPMTTREPPTSAVLDSFLNVVNDPANQPVFVHCVGGRHRTGVMTAVYRMAQAGWTAEQAFKEMKQFRFGADFLHPEFKTFVFGYGAELARAAATSAAKTVGGSPQ